MSKRVLTCYLSARTRGYEALELRVCAIFQECAAGGGRRARARERETESFPLPDDTGRPPQHRQHGVEQSSNYVVHALTKKRERKGRVAAHGSGGAYRYAKMVLAVYDNFGTR